MGLGHSDNPNSVMNAVLAAGAKRRFLSVADLNLPDTDRSGGADPVLAATLEPGSQPLVDAAETRPAGRPAAVATDPVVTPVGVSGAPVASTPVVAGGQTSTRTVPIGGANGFLTTHVTASLAADQWVTAVAAPLSGAATSDPSAPVVHVDRRQRSTTARPASSAVLLPTRYSARGVRGGVSVSRYTDAMAVSDAQPHQPIGIAGLFDQALEAFASDPKRLKSSAIGPNDEVMRDYVDSLYSRRSMPAQGSTTDRYTLTVGAVTPRKLKVRGPGALRP